MGQESSWAWVSYNSKCHASIETFQKKIFSLYHSFRQKYYCLCRNMYFYYEATEVLQLAVQNKLMCQRICRQYWLVILTCYWGSQECNRHKINISGDNIFHSDVVHNANTNTITKTIILSSLKKLHTSIQI